MAIYEKNRSMENTKKYLLIIPMADGRFFFERNFSEIIQITDSDILIVNDNSDDWTSEKIQETDGIISIRHEFPLGYGTSFIHGYEYGRDMGYEFLIYLNPNNEQLKTDVEQMIAHINYGYDIVSCSRILENHDAALIEPAHINMMETLSGALLEASGLDITDPVSGILAVQTKILESMELTDETHGVLLQLWIQAAYMQMTCFEVPSNSGTSFGMEFQDYEDPMEDLLSTLETEKYLYPRRDIN